MSLFRRSVGTRAQVALFEARLAARTVVKNPWFSIFTALTLTLGIGLSLGGFIVLREVVLQPLPYPEAERLYLVFNESLLGRSGLTVRQLAELDASGVFAGVAGYRMALATVQLSGEPRRLEMAFSTASLPDTLGVSPFLGRRFQSSESDVVLISHDLWRRQFGSDPNILGKTLKIGGRINQIVGVLPPEAVLDSGRPDLWVPLREADSAPGRFLTTLVRLRRNFSIPELAGRVSRLLDLPRDGPREIHLHSLLGAVRGGGRDLAILLQIGTLSVLLAGSGTVAMLLLSRLAQGSGLQGLAVRKSLGADGAALSIQVAAQVTLLTLPGLLFGSAAPWLLKPWLRSAAQLAQFEDLRLDFWHLLAVLVIVAATILVCVVPVLFNLSTVNVSGLLSQSGVRTAPRWGKSNSILLATQLALTLMFLVGSGVSLSTLLALGETPLGFQADHALVAESPAPESGSLAARRQFWRELTENIVSDPEIESAGLTSRVPFHGGSTLFLKALEDGKEVPFELISAGPNLFPALGVGLVAGREFDETDNETGPGVAIVNQAAARILFPDGDPVGRTLTLFRPLTVVGLSANHMTRFPQVDPKPIIWVPFFQADNVGDYLVVRGSIQAGNLKRLLRERINRIDPDRPLEILNLKDLARDPLRKSELASTVATVFGAVLLLFAAGMLVGTVSLAIRRKSREVALRMALGAVRADIVRHQLGSVAVPVLCGVAAGLVGSAWLTGFLSSLSPVVVPFSWTAWLVPPAAFFLLSLAVAGVTALLQTRSIDLAGELKTE